MKGEVKLFIGGEEVDLTQEISILFTYSADELVNPTIVKNSYSKTVVIEDTPQNSRIFGQFWNVQRIQSADGEYGVSFNPSKRVPFTIYVNGDIYQTGYAKLLNVKSKGKNNTYEVSMFGGLGSFFFNLSYLGENTEDNKRKLSDLRYISGYTGASENEFNFTIKKETVQDAWNHIDDPNTSMWHYINFAPCYNGLPDDFDANKVLMNFGSTAATSADTSTAPVRRPGSQGAASLPTISSTTDGSYSLYDGYTLAELPKDYTADEMREFRSYLMRPVLRVKGVIEACCDPENNGGYTVDLDDSFFNSSNPYWQSAYMTLPLLTELEFSGNEGDDQSGVTATIGSKTTGGTTNGTIYKETTAINLGEISAASSFNFSMDVNLQALVNALPSGYKTQDDDWKPDRSVTHGMYMSPQAIYPCAYSEQSNTRYPGTIIVQLVAYSRDGKVIAGTDMYNCTSGYNPQRTSAGGRGGATMVTTHVPDPNEFPSFDAEFEAGYITKSGQFNYVSGSSSSTSTWQMADTLNFTLKKLPKTCSLKLIVTKVNGTSQSYSNKSMCLFQRYYTYTLDSQGYVSSYSTSYRSPATINSFRLLISNVNVSVNSDAGIKTGAKFTKGDLLNTDYSPADFFLSYCKLFGLYITKDRYDDIIHVMTRDTFYRKENVIDLSDRIDISKEVKITPLVFDAKWYTFKLEGEDTLFSEQYKSTYGADYGQQRVNTGYNFDASEKNLYENSIFKSGVECLEKSEMFSYVSADTSTKPWMYDGFEYPLYKTDDMEDTINVEIQPRIKAGQLKSFNPDYKYYDLFSKLQFHGDDNSAAEGSNVLVFFNGSVLPKTSTNEDVNYWITDDNSYMAVLNDNTPCWLWTTKEEDVTEEKIALKVTSIPQFTRYYAKPEVGFIQQSWDFGVPKQLYIPTYTTDYDSTLYTNYWRSYISDMYDVNSKMMTAYVNIDETPSEEWLRDFFWFRNSLWRISKIEDADAVKKGPTKIEFIKVQDMDNYSNVNVSSIPYINISAATTTVSNSGGTVTIYVDVSDGGNWYVSDPTYTSYNASASSGHGDGSFTIQIPANHNNYAVIHHISVGNDYGQWGYCEVVQRDVVLSVRQFAQYSNTDVPWSGGTCLYEVTSTYPWSVVADRTYVSFNPSSAQQGIHNTEVTWEPSDSLAPRNVKMTFTDSIGTTVDVYKWQEQCRGLIYDHSGGTQVVQFLSGADYTVPEWLSVTDNGDNTYNVTAIANPDMDSRTVTIYFNKGSESSAIQVLQYAGVIFDVVRSDGTGSVLAAGGDIELTVTSNVPWSTTTYSNWSVPLTTAGTTSATITVRVAQNDDEARKGTIMFNHTGGIFYYTVSQNGINTDNFVDPVALVFPGSGDTKTFNINTTSDVWMIVGKPSWVTVSPTGGTGNATVSVTVPESNDWERSGSIVVYNSSTTKTYVVSVMQDTGDVWKVARVNGSGDIPATGGLCYLEVTSPNHSWTATTNDSFISVSPTTYTASTGVYVTFSANSGESRTATITFDNGVSTPITYTQAQDGYGQLDLVSPSVLVYEASGGPQNVLVNIPNTWQVVGRPNWVVTTPSSGYTSGMTVEVYAQPYSGNAQRTGSLVFADMTTNKVSVVNCIQNPGDGEVLAVSPRSIVFESSGGTATLTIISNTDWVIG